MASAAGAANQDTAVSRAGAVIQEQAENLDGQEHQDSAEEADGRVRVFLDSLDSLDFLDFLVSQDGREYQDGVASLVLAANLDTAAHQAGVE